ncbi:BZ3500_MvSof-1268-A1-R1_Chr5-2g07809 [Microbotryum saponariae]|uniref:BZ3500_MvSof-1268-A1-R1_Chr5-2g07809 protein n=1 Tax=Microbotryum saponariae TaxID=289078 RepID=A0A2X0LKK6_9BASI|nr:BZ3500_MvSof-1268-A1-R1_Chr5-2g07809 [Microbotryum saponariae]SDA05678.1 BZ3501_MvSof-1269-A2-R1_Chr5-2g07631 [Microbotryum saponariae]
MYLGCQSRSESVATTALADNLARIHVGWDEAHNLRSALLRILVFAIDQLGSTEQRRALANYSLVAKSWTGPAQSLLFGHLVFMDESAVVRWLALSDVMFQSPAIDHHNAESVYIDGRGGQVTNVSTDQVLRRVRGIKRLRIDFVNNLSTSVFTYPHLDTLTSLTLHTKLWVDPIRINLPFSLHHFVLGGSYHPLAFIHAVFSNAIRTLESLTTTMQAMQSPSQRALMNDSISRLEALRSFVDFQRSAEDFVGLLARLPSTIEEISTSFVDRNRLRLLTAALGQPHLGRLRSLRFMYMPRGELLSTEAGRDFIAFCRDRRINIVHGHALDCLREEHALASNEQLKVS